MDWSFKLVRQMKIIISIMTSKDCVPKNLISYKTLRLRDALIFRIQNSKRKRKCVNVYYVTWCCSKQTIISFCGSFISCLFELVN